MVPQMLTIFFFLMIRRPPRSTHCISSAASDVYKRQEDDMHVWVILKEDMEGLGIEKEKKKKLPTQQNSQSGFRIRPNTAAVQSKKKMILSYYGKFLRNIPLLSEKII
eukprot:TRINITY_DN16779_c0_g3_i1.p2 TRINITY_DN16779_c0_g3~~TRINITY_DN16779_c0_g3_i1.p2  ORF type:complete len:108 (-),score=44.26 TRINITY_DN16779_c0_g3_i1:63-386(-)